MFFIVLFSLLTYQKSLKYLYAGCILPLLNIYLEYDNRMKRKTLHLSLRESKYKLSNKIGRGIKGE